VHDFGALIQTGQRTFFTQVGIVLSHSSAQQRRETGCLYPRSQAPLLGISLHSAALFTATFIFPASLLRPLGGWLSDKYGARVVTYAVSIAMSAVLVLLAIPNGECLGMTYKPPAWMFTALSSCWPTWTGIASRASSFLSATGRAPSIASGVS
jgi:MFS family permease